MRKLILLLSMALVSSTGKSQDYTPFDFENGEWFCAYTTKGGMFGGGHGNYYAYDTVKFFCSGDTTISDTVFNKLYYQGYTSSLIVPKTFISGYYGAIRNDTATRSVWFHDGFQNHRIYNFIMTEDSILCNETEFPLPVSFYLCGEVKSIDSLVYCDKYFKEYSIEDQQGHIRSIAEGIGSTRGLFPVFSDPWHSDLICYSERQNHSCQSCQSILLSMNEISDPLLEIQVSVTGDQLIISSENFIHSLEVVDVLGRILYKNRNINPGSTKITLNQRGPFIIRARTHDRIRVIKAYSGYS